MLYCVTDVLCSCGAVANLSCGTSGGSSVCYTYQLNYTNPQGDYNLATYLPGSAPIRYTLLSNGVQQTHIDGWSCGAFVRVVSINYVCDATYPTAAVTSYQVNNCVYNITVSTAAVCATPYANTYATCAGAGYDLSKTVAGVEMSAYINGATWITRPCAQVAGAFSLTLGCNGQVCQTGYNLSYFDTSAQWYAADNGVVQITQTGQLCGSANRWTVLRFVCNILAVTPYISDAGEEPSCHYFLTIQTNAVCAQPANYNAVGATWVSDQVTNQTSHTAKR